MRNILEDAIAIGDAAAHLTAWNPRINENMTGTKFEERKSVAKQFDRKI